MKRIRESSRLPVEQTQEFGREYQNLLVRLPGSDEKLNQEVVIVGAHYDHVGYGKPSNSHGPFGQIHNGADDNASGTAALLELAKAFKNLPEKPECTVIFLAVTEITKDKARRSKNGAVDAVRYLFAKARIFVA